MNLLSLISSWLDIICQITIKCITVPKLTTFHQLNRANNQRHDMKKNVSITLFSLTTSEESNVHFFFWRPSKLFLYLFIEEELFLYCQESIVLFWLFFLFCLSLSREYLNICAASSSSLFVCLFEKGPFSSWDNKAHLKLYEAHSRIRFGRQPAIFSRLDPFLHGPI